MSWIKTTGTTNDPTFPSATGYISVKFGVGGAIMGTPNIYHVFKTGGGWYASYIFNKDEKKSFAGLVTTGDPETDFPLHEVASSGPLDGYYIESRQIVKSEYVTQVQASGTKLANCGT